MGSFDSDQSKSGEGCPLHTHLQLEHLVVGAIGKERQEELISLAILPLLLLRGSEHKQRDDQRHTLIVGACQVGHSAHCLQAAFTDRADRYTHLMGPVELAACMRVAMASYGPPRARRPLGLRAETHSGAARLQHEVSKARTLGGGPPRKGETRWASSLAAFHVR